MSLPGKVYLPLRNMRQRRWQEPQEEPRGITTKSSFRRLMPLKKTPPDTITIFTHIIERAGMYTICSRDCPHEYSPKV